MGSAGERRRHRRPAIRRLCRRLPAGARRSHLFAVLGDRLRMLRSAAAPRRRASHDRDGHLLHLRQRRRREPPVTRVAGDGGGDRLASRPRLRATVLPRRRTGPSCTHNCWPTISSIPPTWPSTDDSARSSWRGEERFASSTRLPQPRGAGRPSRCSGSATMDWRRCRSHWRRTSRAPGSSTP